MIKAIISSLMAIALSINTSSAFADWVNGYTKSNGTYVSGHFRSAPDGYKFNNYNYR